MMDKLPVTLIGGYLGAGKTTLVNQLLRHADGMRIAVLVNEFGEMPIDDDLIEARDEDLISIAGGCICCSFGNDLIAALETVSALSPRPDHIVIEASGVALPAPIANTIELLEGLTLAGVCVLVDSTTILTARKDDYIGDTIERQLTDADLIVLTKCDVVSAAQTQTIQDTLSQTWPTTPQIIAQNGSVSSAVLLGHIATGRTRVLTPHSDEMYDSVFLSFDAACDVDSLVRKLQDPELGVVRAKGYVDDLSGRRALVQLVSQRLDLNYPETVGELGIIVIGLKHSFDRKRIQALGKQISSEAAL